MKPLYAKTITEAAFRRVFNAGNKRIVKDWPMWNVFEVPEAIWDIYERTPLGVPLDERDKLTVSKVESYGKVGRLLLGIIDD